MKSWMMVLLAALCAGTVMAQSRNGKQKQGKSKNNEAGQFISIKEISSVGGESDYAVEAPTTDDNWKKVKINHVDSYKKEGAKGWHFFEVAYEVDKVGIDPEKKKTLPLFVLPEVEITYALLYDMTESKHTSSVKSQANKAGGAIGWDKPDQTNILFSETVVYSQVTPGRVHYAAVCVPPNAVVLYGKPIVFSVQIKVDGVQQGEIETQFLGGKKIEGKEITSLLVGAKKEKIAWWETIQTKSKTVQKVDNVLRDRSQTPFALVGDMYYDQVKAK